MRRDPYIGYQKVDNLPGDNLTKPECSVTVFTENYGWF